MTDFNSEAGQKQLFNESFDKSIHPSDAGKKYDAQTKTAKIASEDRDVLNHMRHDEEETALTSEHGKEHVKHAWHHNRLVNSVHWGTLGKEELGKATQHPSPDIRHLAYSELGRRMSQAANGITRRGGWDENGQLRAKLPFPKEIKDFIALGAKDPDRKIRERVMDSFNHLWDDELLGTYLNNAEDPSEFERLLAGIPNKAWTTENVKKLIDREHAIESGRLGRTPTEEEKGTILNKVVHANNTIFRNYISNLQDKIEDDFVKNPGLEIPDNIDSLATQQALESVYGDKLGFANPSPYKSSIRGMDASFINKWANAREKIDPSVGRDHIYSQAEGTFNPEVAKDIGDYIAKNPYAKVNVPRLLINDTENKFADLREKMMANEHAAKTLLPFVSSAAQAAYLSKPNDLFHNTMVLSETQRAIAPEVLDIILSDPSARRAYALKRNDGMSDAGMWHAQPEGAREKESEYAWSLLDKYGDDRKTINSILALEPRGNTPHSQKAMEFLNKHVGKHIQPINDDDIYNYVHDQNGTLDETGEAQDSADKVRFVMALARNPFTARFVLPQLIQLHDASMEGRSPGSGHRLAGKHHFLDKATVFLDHYIKKITEALPGVEGLRKAQEIVGDKTLKTLPIYKQLMKTYGLAAPDDFAAGKVNVKFNSHKLRILRDAMAQRGVKEVHPNELGPGNWSAGRTKSGNIDLEKLIESIPAKTYNFTEGVYTGKAQQHRPQLEQPTFQLNATSDMLNQIDALGIGDQFRAIHRDSLHDSHPAGPGGIGWVRWDGDNRAVMAEEAQSDLDKNIRYKISKLQKEAADLKEETKGIDPNTTDNDQKWLLDRQAKVQSELNAWKKVPQILWGGKHPSQVLHEAFLEYIRSHKGWTDAAAQIPDLEMKKRISLGRPDEAPPIHFIKGYREVPRDVLGFLRGKYGDTPWMHVGDRWKAASTKWYQAEEERGGKWPEGYDTNRQMDRGAPIWQEKVRKREKESIPINFMDDVTAESFLKDKLIDYPPEFKEWAKKAYPKTSLSELVGGWGIRDKFRRHLYDKGLIEWTAANPRATPEETKAFADGLSDRVWKMDGDVRLAHDASYKLRRLMTVYSRTEKWFPPHVLLKIMDHPAPEVRYEAFSKLAAMVQMANDPDIYTPNLSAEDVAKVRRAAFDKALGDTEARHLYEQNNWGDVVNDYELEKLGEAGANYAIGDDTASQLSAEKIHQYFKSRVKSLDENSDREVFVDRNWRLISLLEKKQEGMAENALREVYGQNLDTLNYIPSAFNWLKKSKWSDKFIGDLIKRRDALSAEPHRADDFNDYVGSIASNLKHIESLPTKHLAHNENMSLNDIAEIALSRPDGALLASTVSEKSAGREANDVYPILDKMLDKIVNGEYTLPKSLDNVLAADMTPEEEGSILYRIRKDEKLRPFLTKNHDAFRRSLGVANDNPEENSKYIKDVIGQVPSDDPYSAYRLMRAARRTGWEAPDDMVEGIYEKFIKPNEEELINTDVDELSESDPKALKLNGVRDLADHMSTYAELPSDVSEKLFDFGVRYGDSDNNIADNILPKLSVDSVVRMHQKHGDKLKKLNGWEVAERRIALTNPEQFNQGILNVKYGLNKVRILRDELAQQGISDVHPKELKFVPKHVNLNPARLKNGNINLQKLIDSQPSHQFSFTEGSWEGGMQQHISMDSQPTLQIGLTTPMVAKLKEAGVWPLFEKMHAKAASYSAHPLGPAGLGWVRWSGDEKQGVFPEEFQTDFGQFLNKKHAHHKAALDKASVGLKESTGKLEEMLSAMSEMQAGSLPAEHPYAGESLESLGNAIKLQKMRVARHAGTVQDHQEAINQLNAEYPPEQVKKINEIIWHGKHPSEALQEAFQEYGRTVKGWAGVPVSTFDVEVKKENLGDPNAPAPRHYIKGYREIPRDVMGWKPGIYGDHPVHANEERQPHEEKEYVTTDADGTDVYETKQIPGQPIWKDQIRKFEIPSRFKQIMGLRKAESVPSHNLDDMAEIAEQQLGLGYAIRKSFEAARYLVNGSEVPVQAMMRAYDGLEDPDAAALRAYGMDVTPETLNSLKLAANLSLSKQEVVASYKVTPYLPEAQDVAEAVQRGIDDGYLNPIKLNGKHSKGTMIVKDPKTHKVYLLKPGSGKNSPALGVNEDFSTQSEREAAFWHVARALGIDGNFPRCELVLVNGHQTAAMELLPRDYKNLGEAKKFDANVASRALRPYLDNASLMKWSALDWILGNPDRHSQNIMLDPSGTRVYLIDHGSAMAGQAFDPANDDNSFIPFYLRAFTGRRFKEMHPDERVHFMPTLSASVDRQFETWLDEINEKQIEAILSDYNINPEPALMRLAKLKAMPGQKSVALNKLWAGDME